MAITAGSEFLVNSTAANAGFATSVAGQADGRFLVTWVALTEPFDEEEYDSRNSYDIIGRAFDGGSPLGGDFLVNREQRDGQFNPQAVARDDGSYIVAYSSGEENRLEGTFAASQIVGTSGALIEPEQFGDYSYYHFNPDIAVAPDGRYVVVSSEEFSGELQRHAADGTILEETLFGFTNSPTTVSATAVDAARYLVVWSGYESEDAAFDPESANPDPGVYAQIRGFDGSAGAIFRARVTSGNEADVTVRTLGDGRVALLFRGEAGYVLSIVDADAGTASTPVAIAAAAAQVEIAVLDTGAIVAVWADYSGADGSGTAIQARLFDGAGQPNGDAFLVNEVVAGNQLRPSVAATGEGRFVVGWEGGDGIKARVFDSDGGDASTSPLFDRAGTIDLSPSANQTTPAATGPNSVYVDLAAASGRDTITAFGKDDVLLTRGRLFDGNGDGIVTFGRNGVLDLDGPGAGTDTIRTAGGAKALRYLGESAGLSVYADAAGRPKGAIEGMLAGETLRGDAGGAKDVFFYDTALGASLGDDRIERFGGTDLLVTTTKIVDANDDGVIGFGVDKLLDLGPDAIAFTDAAGGTIRALEYDGAVAHGGATYFVYSLVGSAAGTADLTF